MKISQESLLRIPLVRQMMSDPSFSLMPRGLDNGWVYQHVIPARMTGFNPLYNGAFYARNSLMAQWLKEPWRSARYLNENDELLVEVLYAVHDYLHFWAYRAICLERPELGFGTRAITKENIEDFVFCHLVTEAVATAGLDCWFLCAQNLNEICNIGSNLIYLTTFYRIENEVEYRRYNPGFSAQEPEFLNWLTELYVIGRPQGFDAQAQFESPKTRLFLDKEILYGKKQREYTRAWLSYLSGGKATYTSKELSGSVDFGEKWKRDLVATLSKRLWMKVKDNKNWKCDGRFDRKKIWKIPKASKPDYRFVNWNQKPQTSTRGLTRKSEEELKYMMSQWISQHAFESFDTDRVDKIRRFFREGRYEGLPSLLMRHGRVIKKMREPRDIFVLI